MILYVYRTDLITEAGGHRYMSGVTQLKWD